MKTPPEKRKRTKKKEKEKGKEKAQESDKSLGGKKYLVKYLIEKK